MFWAFSSVPPFDKLKDALRAVTPSKHGKIGHNNPPPDDEAPQTQAVIDIQHGNYVIERELKKEIPDALAIAKATSKLKSAFGYLGKTVDAAVDSFAKAIGTSAAAATAGGLAYAANQLSPGFHNLFVKIAQHAVQWLA
jgi:hypothetical protein